MIVGIDYGSKLAGTTAIAFLEHDELRIISSEKKKDADAFILDTLDKLSFSGTVFIDAPLSLPGVYRHLSGYTDYHYRQADRDLHAMSPMFLGGLTARAMQLAETLRKRGNQVIEAYPGARARKLHLHEFGYKKEKSIHSEVIHRLTDFLDMPLAQKLSTWHEVDAVLAYCIGVDYERNEADLTGDPTEGLIYF